MEVRLMTHDLAVADMEYNAAYAMLTCHANTDKLNTEGANVFIERAIKAGHESILEHITLTFEVNNLSRACLQELARHRHISLSVESTRHTLKEKLNSDEEKNFAVANNNICLGGMFFIDSASESLSWAYINTLENIAQQFPDLSADKLKYFIPEFWPTNLVLTVNIRELRHILKLRTTPAALKEFQDLCHALFEAVPEDYRYMLKDCIYNKEEN